MIRLQRLAFVLILCVVALGEAKVTVPERTSEWHTAEKGSQNAVVQIMSQHAPFNWLEPYKSPEQTQGSGTGFLIDDQGSIITNFHVVEQAKSLRVFIPALGQKPIDAYIVGVCPEADVAYIRLCKEGVDLLHRELKKIPFLHFGDSDTLFPTEPVLALGYPLGQRYLKSTVGVIAGREYIDGRSFMHVTAPLNPGNSGGPLLNLDGKVIGVNSAIISGSQNIGYMIPSYYVQILMNDLIQDKLVAKPHPGIRFNATTDTHAKLLGNPVPAGVYINTVDLHSSAHAAGVKEGDMLYAINGYAVDAYGDVAVNWVGSSKVSLDEFLIRLPSGKAIDLVVYRAGVQKKISCVKSTPEKPAVRQIFPDYEPHEVDYEVVGGLCIMQLRKNHISVFENYPRLTHYYLPENKHKKRLLVTSVIPGSVFDHIGCIRPGYIISEVNNVPVTTLQELREALAVSTKTGHVHVCLDNRTATVADVDALLLDEKRITQAFKFESTPAIKELQKRRALDVVKTKVTRAA